MNQKAQDRIHQLLDEELARGARGGIQIAAYHRGRLVVDAWAGTADPNGDKLVGGETLFPVFSTTKGVTATIIHLLAERGKLNYDDPISKHWPEFGANGKSAVTVRQAMNHTAGLQDVPTAITSENGCDWKNACSAMAASKPSWQPGSKAAYHAVTFGWILGELAQRVDGRPFSKILHDEIEKPLSVEGLYVGIPDEVESRVAILEEANVAPQAPASGPRPIPDWMWPLPVWMNRADVRRACVPGSNGIMTARAVAKLYASLLPGGVQGVELLPPKRIALATDLKSAAYDKTAQNPTVWTLGYMLTDGLAALENQKISPFGHGGYGGSTGFADPANGFAFAYAKNVYGKEGFNAPVLEVIREALGI